MKQAQNLNEVVVKKPKHNKLNADMPKPKKKEPINEASK